MSVVRRGAGSGGRAAGRRNPAVRSVQAASRRASCRRFGGGTSTGDDGADRQTPRAERRSLFGGSWCYQSHALSHFAHGVAGLAESPAFRAPFSSKGSERRFGIRARPRRLKNGARGALSDVRSSPDEAKRNPELSTLTCMEAFWIPAFPSRE